MENKVCLINGIGRGEVLRNSNSNIIVTNLLFNALSLTQ